MKEQINNKKQDREKRIIMGNSSETNFVRVRQTIQGLDKLM